MSRLSSINVEQYRAFEQGLTVELRPLTLIYGRNNAGKSSIVRLLSILDDSLSESAESPVDLRGEAGKGATFSDILNARNRELKRIKLTLTWDDKFTAKWSIGLHRLEGTELVLIEELLVMASSAAGQAPSVCWYGHPKVPEATRPDGAAVNASLTFRGLMPQQRPDLHVLIGELRNRLLEYRGQVQYLCAVRAELERFVEERNVKPSIISPFGDGAQSVILADEPVFLEVAGWLRREVERDLRKVPIGPKIWQWLLPPQGAPDLAIPLASTGEGMTQLLPILVALALRRTRQRTTGLNYYAFEEPTTHLHDDLQIRLAAHLGQLAMEDTPPTIVLETHARPLLLGVQWAIKQGLDPSRVIVYWVDQDSSGISRADAVEFDGNGLPKSHHLRTAFEEERKLLRDLSSAYLQGKVSAPA